MVRCLLLGALAAALLPTCQAQEMISTSDAQADAQALYEGLQAAQYDLYVNTPKPVFDQYYQELQDRLEDGPISPAAFHSALQRFAAHAPIAHTRIEGFNPGFLDYMSDEALVFPLSFEVREGEVIVTQAPSGSSVRPGDRIMALEGASNADWLARLTRNISSDTPALAYSQMQGMELYYIWLEYGPLSRFTLALEDAAGVRRQVELDAVPMAALSDREGAERIDLSGRDARMLTGDIAYLRPGPFYNTAAQTAQEAYDPEALAAYTAFIDDAFDRFIDQGAQALILDVRDNPGGDNSWSDPVIAWFADRPFRFASEFRIRVSDLSTASNQARIDAAPGGPSSTSQMLADLYDSAPNGETVSFELPYAHPREGRRFDGAVYALVDRRSFSNAVSVGAIVQDYGFGAVIGEATTDMTTTLGAMEQFTLPHSGLVAGYPKALIIRPNGDTHTHPLEPDVRLPGPRLGDQGDVMLDAAITHIERQRR